MPPSVTVKAVRSDEKTQLEQAVLAGQQALAADDTSLAVANAGVNRAAQILAALQDQEASLRRQLAAASMPADINQLEQDLEANLLLQPPAAAALAAAQDTVATTTRRRQRDASNVDVALSRLTLADAALTSATRDDDQANGWRAALGGAEVAAVVATAKSAPVAALVVSAGDQLKVLLGDAALYDLLTSRYDDAVSAAAERTDAAERAAAALDAVISSRAAVDGAVAAKAAVYLTFRSALQAVTEQAGAQLAWAQTSLAAAAGPSPVTASEQTRIDARAAAVVANPDAAALEQAVQQARVTARVATAELEAKTLPKKALDPTYDPAADNTVTALLTAATTADNDLASAVAALTASASTRIDQWEVTLPPVLLALTVETLRAVAVIDRLANATDPATLLTGFDTAESDYATALQARDTTQALVDAAAADAARRADDAAAVASVADLRVAAAVRGDA